jgi:hypothetical protein
MDGEPPMPITSPSVLSELFIRLIGVRTVRSFVACDFTAKEERRELSLVTGGVIGSAYSVVVGLDTAAKACD